MSDGSELQVCGAATENARRANSVRVLAADSSRASEDRRGRTGTADWIRSCKLQVLTVPRLQFNSYGGRPLSVTFMTNGGHRV